ncbi:MAG: LysM peptidoglycan-binding domain-containing protein [Actinomycetota bacterium]|nr:LysM peptidoglycan-binding domain-containing protein [Actinomycetota bacterium]
MATATIAAGPGDGGSRAGAPPRRHPPATYRRRRVAAAGVVVAVVLSAWVGVRGALSALAGPRVELIGAHVVVVRPGDTLWSIAVAEDPNGNVLALLDRLESETHDRPLQVGERIVVP